MDGIVINIDPVAFHVGGLEVRWYSLAILTAVIVAVIISAREAKRKGINPEVIGSGAIWAVVGGIIGARVFHVMEHLDYYSANPSQLLRFEGLAIWGAVVGGAIALLIFTKRRQLPFLRLADVIVPGLLVAQIIGRLGCIVNGDAYGNVTSLPWGFIYTHPDAMIPSRLMNVPTHPYPVYEMLWNGMVLLIILRLRRHFKTDGMLLLSYLAFYAVGRFALSFVREEKIWFWGLQEAQVIALLALTGVMAASFYIHFKRQSQKEYSPALSSTIGENV